MFYKTPLDVALSSRHLWAFIGFQFEINTPTLSLWGRLLIFS